MGGFRKTGALPPGLPFAGLAVFILLLSAGAAAAFAQPGREKVNQGNKLYEKEQYDEAMNKYRDAAIESPASPIIGYNIGAVHYKKQKFDEALQHFEKATGVRNPDVQSMAYYNLGNALFRSGKIVESIGAYKRALELNTLDEDAKFNLEFARAILKEHAEKDQSPESHEQQQQQMSREGNGSQNEDGGEKQNGDEERGEDEQKMQSAEGTDGNEQETGDENEEQGEEAHTLTKEQAEQILKALENDEREDMKEAKKRQAAGSGRVLKDW